MVHSWKFHKQLAKHLAFGAATENAVHLRVCSTRGTHTLPRYTPFSLQPAVWQVTRTKCTPHTLTHVPLANIKNTRFLAYKVHKIHAPPAQTRVFSSLPQTSDAPAF